MDSHSRIRSYFIRFRYCAVVLLILLLFGFITSGKLAAADNQDEIDVNKWCDSLGSSYRTYNEFRKINRVMKRLLPDNFGNFLAGKTTENKPMTALVFAKNIKSRTIGKPIIKFVAGIYGDEVAGISIVLLLACDIFKAYYYKNEYFNVYSTVDIHLIPFANPDATNKFVRKGASKKECETSWKPKNAFQNMEHCENIKKDNCKTDGRCNLNGTDLNEAFPIEVLKQFPDLPDYIFNSADEKIHKEKHYLEEPRNETKVLMKWITAKETPWVLSVAYEAGPPIVRIPYDSVAPYISNVPNYKSYNYGAYSRTPDDEMFQILASVYTLNSNLNSKVDKRYPDCSCIRQKTELDYANGACTNTKKLDLKCTDGMENLNVTAGGARYVPENEPYFCNQFYEFDESQIITNGAFWRNSYGSMQDYNYIYSNCFEITVHYGSCKNPPSSELKDMYEKDHQQPVLKIIDALSHHMVFGVVSEIDKVTKQKVPLLNAVIMIEGNEKNMTTSDRGEYWRLLNAGKYIMTVRHNDTKKEHSCFESRQVSISRTIARREDFLLEC